MIEKRKSDSIAEHDAVARAPRGLPAMYAFGAELIIAVAQLAPAGRQELRRNGGTDERALRRTERHDLFRRRSYHNTQIQDRTGTRPLCRANGPHVTQNTGAGRVDPGALVLKSNRLRAAPRGQVIRNNSPRTAAMVVARAIGDSVNVTVADPQTLTDRRKRLHDRPKSQSMDGTKSGYSRRSIVRGKPFAPDEDIDAAGSNGHLRIHIHGSSSDRPRIPACKRSSRRARRIPLTMSTTVSNSSIVSTEPYGDIIVRPITEDDGAAFYAMCARLPMRTLTPRLNIEAHGFQGSIVRSWGVFDPSGREMEGLLVRYGNTAVAVDHDGTCARAFARLIDKERNIAGVRGSLEAVSGIQALLRHYTPSDWEDSYFLVQRKPTPQAHAIGAIARRATPDDRDLLAELYSGAGPMYRSRSNVSAKLAETRVFVVEEPPDGHRPRRIASCALLNVEGADAGLIGGVYTLPSVRGRGYAAACTSLLAADLQRDSKTPCLFYENPIAGKVYRRLGFEDASRWAVLYLTPNSAGRAER